MDRAGFIVTVVLAVCCGASIYASISIGQQAAATRAELLAEMRELDREWEARLRRVDEEWRARFDLADAYTNQLTRTMVVAGVNPPEKELQP